MNDTKNPINLADMGRKFHPAPEYTSSQVHMGCYQRETISSAIKQTRIHLKEGNNTEYVLLLQRNGIRNQYQKEVRKIHRFVEIKYTPKQPVGLKEIRKYFQRNENEDKTCQNL